MVLRPLLAALLFAAPALAEPPATRPSPAELARQIVEYRAKQAARAVVPHFELDADVRERPAAVGLFGGPAPALLELVDRMRAARLDPDVPAVLVSFKPGAALSIAQAQELREQVRLLREAGKPVFAYADTYDTPTYLVASAADYACTLAAGEIFLPGVSIEATFYKGLFDKIGVTPDYVQVGEFKGAQEPFTRTEPSAELAQELDALAGGLYDQIVTAIAKSRGLSKEAVRKVIDDAGLFADEALEQGFVDHVLDPDGLRPLIAETIGTGGEDGRDLNLDAEYATEKEDAPDLSNPLAVLARLNRKEPDSGAPKIALVYAEGVIVDGEGGDGPAIPLLAAGPSVGSETIRRAMREIARDETIKAVVIRIDSPGGSALASEAMWQAVRRVAEEKPVIVSVGAVAASGGYYLLSAGEYVYADPASVVGSIGVVGGKLVLGDLYDKLGLTTARFGRGQNADLFSDTQPWTPAQRRLIRRYMERTYDQFTDRVMRTRGDKIADIDEVARGRVFLAADAVELGLIDELGGIEDAIAHAAGAAGFTDTSYEVKIVPEPTFDPSSLFGGLVQTPAASAAALLPDARQAMIARQLRLATLLRDRPAVLLAPFVVTTQ